MLDIKKYMYGEYSHSIDAKGRLTIPSKLREKLGELCYVSRGADGCLFIFSEDEWALYVDAMLGNNKFTQKGRLLQREIFSKAAEVTYDKQGRILIPVDLRELGRLQKEVMIVGSGNHVELWDKTNYDNLGTMSDEDLAELFETALEDNMRTDRNQ